MIGNPLSRVHQEFEKHQHLDTAKAMGTPEETNDFGSDPMQDLVRYMGYVDGDMAKEVGKAPGGVSTGTTIMGVEFEGGVVLGADSRTSTGDYVANRTSRKISRVHEKIFVCRSGSAADTQALTGFVVNHLEQHAIELGTLPSVNTAANLFRQIAYNNKDHLTAGMIIGGWDPKRGPQIYSIPLGGTMIRQKCATGGSGSAYIAGLVDDLFKEKMSKKDAMHFVAKSISHAMARDGSSGGLIRMTVITEEGVEEVCVHGEQNLPFTLK